ncbi:transcriptional regulator, LysR family [Bordetella hinzii CA90 BAL1384]|uniref:LysR family transcriptional regulator n=1 Tax=Bordetella hinzii TaxID=103855 RepID=UPI000459828D|nr:LysR family transcriptional regulator [Bordetella hinzii]KCB33225.1 transcriptional regulator, LysR family [Bordetella hinzii CA90 BAL1384]
MKLDVLGVQAFVALAERESFGKAAESLYISQAALSRRIRNLETYLGVRLVDRTTRSVSLSTVGRGFLPQARRLLGELESTLQQIREQREVLAGNVTMACVPTVGVRFLPRVLQAYAAAFPGNRVSVLDHSSAGVEQAVRDGAAEFGIGIADRLAPEIEHEELLHDRFVLVCQAGSTRGRKRTPTVGTQAMVTLPASTSRCSRICCKVLSSSPSKRLAWGRNPRPTVLSDTDRVVRSTSLTPR